MSISRLLVFITIATGVVVGLHYYLWARLVRDTQLPPSWRQIGTVTMVVLAIALPVSLALGRAAHGVLRPLLFGAYAWMGIAFLLFVGVLASDIVKLGIRALYAMQGAPIDEDRRTAIARVLGGLVSLAGIGASGAGMLAAWSPLIQRVKVPLAKLPKSLDGIRIVQITDIHVGPTIGRAYLEKIVAKVNALAPDVIAITGDLVDGSVENLRDQVEPLRDLRARHGVFFVTGNHEYYSGAAAWVAHLATLGIRVLRNEHVRIGDGDASIDLAGVDDFRSRGLAPGHGHDLPAAVAGRDRSRELVLLAHQPKSVFEAVKYGVGLQLSGHTHGGQIFPWNFLVYLDQPFVAGLHKVDGTWVYVSRGTGFWGPPMRLGAPAEITEVTLVSAA